MSPTLSFRSASGIALFWTVCFLVVAVSGADPESPSPKTADDTAVQHLIRQLGSEDFEEREQAAKHLIARGPVVLKLLIVPSRSPDHEVARLAKECIQKIEHNARVATWLHQIQAGKEENRQKASGQLILLGPQLAEVVPALVELLDDPRVQVRETIAYILASAGPKAEVALPKLLRILADKIPGTDHLRMRVMEVLEKIGPPGRKAVPILLQILESEGWEMKGYSAQGLAALGQDDPRVGPALLKAISHDDIRVKGSAVAALSWLRKEPEKVVPEIVQILKTYPFKPNEMYIKRAFFRHLWNYGPLAEPAIPYLIEIWKDYKGDRTFQEDAKMVLVAIGPAAHKAIPGLKELGKNPSDFDFYELIKKLDGK